MRLLLLDGYTYMYTTVCVRLLICKLVSRVHLGVCVRVCAGQGGRLYRIMLSTRTGKRERTVIETR